MVNYLVKIDDLVSKLDMAFLFLIYNKIFNSNISTLSEFFLLTFKCVNQVLKLPCSQHLCYKRVHGETLTLLE